MSLVYAYAIVAGPPHRALAGIAGEQLETIEASGLRVAVGRMPGLPAVTEANLRLHDRTVRSLLRRCDALLPLRFGSGYPDDEALADDISQAAGRLKAALALVRRREQMTARLFDDRAPAAPPPPPARGKQGPGALYLEGRAAHAREPQALDVLRRALAPLVRAERIEVHEARPLVATAYHLVDRDGSRAYRAAVRRIAPALRPVRVSLTGPWPAYAFAGSP